MHAAIKAMHARVAADTALAGNAADAVRVALHLLVQLSACARGEVPVRWERLQQVWRSDDVQQPAAPNACKY